VKCSHRNDLRLKYRDLLAMIRKDGWEQVRTTGSHLHFRHPDKPGTLTIPAGGKQSRDVPPGTLQAILRHAGLEGER
jgi:predicted RNA binding protein YcfA (HicA-like mRNA interferase family)